MKVYVPFFMCSIIAIVLMIFTYNPAYDYILKNNIYGYSKASYEKMIEERIYFNKYYQYVDCNISNKEFDFDNIEAYKQIENCDIELLKVNHLLELYEMDIALEMIEIDFDYMLINKENSDLFLELYQDEYFNPGNLNRYLNYKSSKVILNVNLNHDLVEYKDYKTVDSVSELAVVNKFNRLNSSDSDLSYCIGYYVYSYDMCNDMNDFLSELRTEGIVYSITKVNDRRDLFDEHATGLAIDLDYDYSYDNLVEEIASRYGFIYRYKSEYNEVTGYEEQGHFRYVGKESVEIYELQICLEEYLYYYK